MYQVAGESSQSRDALVTRPARNRVDVAIAVGEPKAAVVLLSAPTSEAEVTAGRRLHCLTSK
jgi:hypothetical protein